MFTLTLQRMYQHQIMVTFIPTVLLWLLSYLTLYIKLDAFNERIMVSITVLLVLAAMLGFINYDLPKTSYFKYINFWFLWYITNIFLITIFHIIIEAAKKYDIKQPNRFSVISPPTLNEVDNSQGDHACVKKETISHEHSHVTCLKRRKTSLKDIKQVYASTMRHRRHINNAGIICFLVANILFNIIYFALQLYNQ